MDTIYDHPLYYDILFSWDRSAEARFYDQVFRQAGLATGARLLEVACGPGRVARLLTERGWQLTGLDASPGMLAFLRAEAKREGLAIATIEADMTALLPPASFDGAFNPMSSFRLLQDDASARTHLGAVAAGLRPGGVYVLDLELVGCADEPAITTDEPWEMQRGDVRVRADDEAITVTDGEEHRVLAWGEEAHLRPMTWGAFEGLVDLVGDLEVASCHPEVGRTASGVSRFDADRQHEATPVGRTLVVLRRA